MKILKRPLLIALLSSSTLYLAGLNTRAAVYKEVGGVVCIEAIHYDYRNFEATDAPIPHHFHVVPDEDGVTTAAHPWGDTHSPDYANSRTGHYLQILPDAGANNGNCPTCPNENVGFPPYAEYKVQITTVGVYQLYLRQMGWDGASDSFFGQILEFAPPGPGPNFYRYAPNPDSPDFDMLLNDPNDTSTTQGWSGYAAPSPVVNGGGGEVKALYNITTPGLYSIRLSQREDGAGVDGVLLQLASLAPPVGSAPESAISTAAPPYIRAVDPTPGQEQVPPDNNIGCQIVDGSTVNVNAASIKMIVDGQAVSPVVTKTNNVTYLSYKPSPLLPSGKSINWSVSFSDNATPAGSYSNSFPFRVLVYSPIPSSFAVPAGSVDTSKPGFLVRPYIPDDTNPDTAGLAIAWTEDAFAGLHGVNSADLSGADAQGYYEVPDVINFDSSTPPVADNFPATLDFPGAPGGTPPVNKLCEEVITWLDLQPGVYRMVVNGDDGYQVSVGVDPRDKAGLILGKIDGAAHTFGDLLMVFQIQTAGIYPFRILYYNTADTIASLEWLVKNAFGTKALINSSTATGNLKVKAYRAGPSFPYVSRLSSSATGFVVDFTDATGAAVTANSIQAKLNGAAITPTIGKTNGVTTITYSSSTPLASGSANTVDLTYTDSTGGGSKSRSFSFTAPTYVTLPPDYAVGAPDTTKPGFKVRVSQIDAEGTTVQPHTLIFTENQLAGTVTNSTTSQPYPNSAAQNTDGTFVYLEPTVINYDATGTGNNGNFTPDNQMPGFPGTGPTGGTDNAAAEVLTYLTLPAGLITMGVNSDDDFWLFPSTNVIDPHNTLVLGKFDGAGRGAADSIFSFAVTQAGTYPMRLIWENGNGGANLEWFSVDSDGTKILINDTSNPKAIKAYQAAAGGAPPADKPKFTAFSVGNGGITLQWSNGGTLESATVVTGPYTPTANSSGTFTEAATGPARFYRVKR